MWKCLAERLQTATDARAVLSQVETELLRNLIELKRAAPVGEGSMYGVEIVNHFPLALRSLQMRRIRESTAAEHEITLTGYSIGPRRRLTVDVDASAFSLEVIGAAWGR